MKAIVKIFAYGVTVGNVMKYCIILIWGGLLTRCNQGASHQERDSSRPRALSHQRDASRVTTELIYVTLGPAQGRQLIVQPYVTGRLLCRERQKPCKIHTKHFIKPTACFNENSTPSFTLTVLLLELPLLTVSNMLDRIIIHHTIS